MELKRREFENLEQKDKTIMRYVKEFTLLSRYASDDVNTDDKRKKRFMRGLHPLAKMQLRMLKAADFPVACGCSYHYGGSLQTSSRGMAEESEA
jgi:hypothetical protein